MSSNASFQFRFISKTIPLIITIVLLSNLATAIVYFNLSNEQFKGDDPFLMISEEMETKNSEVPELFSRLLPVFISLSVVCLLIAVFYLGFITVKITRPMARIRKSIQKIQFGDFHTEVMIKKNEEFSDLMADLNGATALLNVQILAIKENFDDLKQLIKQHPDNNKQNKKSISVRIRAIDDALNYFEMLQPEKPTNYRN